MAFDSQNALDVFKRTMHVMLSSVKLKFALVYLNYIVIFCKTPKKHIDHVRKDLPLLYNAKATLKLKSVISSPIQSII